LIKKLLLIVGCFLCFPPICLGEEPNISWSGNLLEVSLSGNITHGDKLRFIFKENNCDTIHQAFTFYTYSKNPKLSKLEDKVIAMTLNDEPFEATVLFVRPFLMGNSVWFNAGSYWFKNYILKLKQISLYEIKIIDNKDFIAQDYFDIPTNSWSLNNIVSSLYSARKLCLDKSKNKAKAKLVQFVKE